MPERELIERYRRDTNALSARVREELEDFFLTLDLGRPEAVRDAMLAFVPMLTQQYGQVAATLAAEWYEDLRVASGDTRTFRVRSAPAVPAAMTEASVKSAAGHLWTPSPEAALGVLSLAVDKQVKQPGRNTIMTNADREPGARWARVPTGEKTCAFCLMLASRDAVYVSERSASRRPDGEKFHGDCDCVATRISSADDYPEGYLPDNYYEMYTDAREATVDSAGKADYFDTSGILANLRRLHPDAVTDGVHSH
ncbi:VG15 protein [Zhihengliuella halotolerans]|uniref:VG15 protein n=1 Tax=Zhihengliuella halotolerans TaxID=370736 RepID=UPI000C807A86|nr:hypothetical protein [Zhihengliuella halotolerans]